MTSQPVRRATAIAGIATAFALAPVPSYGTAIPGGTTASDDLLVNFDLTNAGSPFLPYQSVTLELNITSPDATAGNMNGGSVVVGVTIDVFDGSSGQGTLVKTSQENIFFDGLDDSEIFTNSGITDGLFSVGLRVAPGDRANFASDAFGEVTVIGEPGSMEGDQTVQSRKVSGVVVTTPTAVPEPATLALMGAGLLCLTFARRRKR